MYNSQFLVIFQTVGSTETDTGHTVKPCSQTKGNNQDKGKQMQPGTRQKARNCNKEQKSKK